MFDDRITFALLAAADRIPKDRRGTSEASAPARERQGARIHWLNRGAAARSRA
jgi:hypothetical protein